MCLEKCKGYEKGMPFTIITDHASLKWLMSQKDLSGRLTRWSLRLQAYDFNIEHRKGSLNVVAYTLSRMDELHDVVGTPINLDDPEFNDPEYIELRDKIEKRNSELQDLKVRNLVIFKKVWISEGLRLQIISNSLRPSSAAHDGGVEKTINLLRRYYF